VSGRPTDSGSEASLLGSVLATADTVDERAVLGLREPLGCWKP
jgi:hypothetical protein